jgi:hypothetical protein
MILNLIRICHDNKSSYVVKDFLPADVNEFLSKVILLYSNFLVEKPGRIVDSIFINNQHKGFQQQI